jgi:hypothetical protein
MLDMFLCSVCCCLVFDAVVIVGYMLYFVWSLLGIFYVSVLGCSWVYLMFLLAVASKF